MLYVQLDHLNEALEFKCRCFFRDKK